MYEELSRCSAAKAFELQASLVQVKCLPHSQITPALKSTAIWKHIPRSRELPYGKKSKYPVVVVTSKSVELEACLLRMKYLVQELFGQLVLSGGHYIHGKKGIMMLAVTLQQLQFQEYLNSNPDHLQDSAYRGFPDYANQCCSQ